MSGLQELNFPKQIISKSEKKNKKCKNTFLGAISLLYNNQLTWAEKLPKTFEAY